MKEKSRILLPVLVALIVLLVLPRTAQSQPPNIVIILADDLGYGDLGSYGAQWHTTPNLDRLAALGVRFTDFYSPAPVCSPSRAALLTGRYPIRTEITRVLKPFSRRGLPQSEITLAQLLKERGYVTGIVGKWHLGDRKPFLPLQHGFDEFFGMPYSNDMRPLRFFDGNRVLRGDIPSSALLTTRYTERARAFIRRHASHPFFLFLSHSMPHYPIDAPTVWKGSSRDGIYGDVIQELDWSVGQVLQALREAGVERRTVVFFTSDNGSWRRQSNGILRGKKGSTWEGGMRVPLVARYPGVFSEGGEVQAPAMGFDLFTTCLALAGVRLPPARPIDGWNLLPVLSPPIDRASLEALEHRPLLFYRGTYVQAVRQGKWKLHIGRHFLGRGFSVIEPELYDLEQDPGESVNLADQHPGVVERLQDVVEGWRKHSGTAEKGRAKYSSP